MLLRYNIPLPSTSCYLAVWTVAAKEKWHEKEILPWQAAGSRCWPESPASFFFFQRSIRSLLLCFLRQSSPLEMSSHCLGWNAGQWASGIFLSLPSQSWVYKCTHPQLRSLCWCSNSDLHPCMESILWTELCFWFSICFSIRVFLSPLILFH